MTNRERQFAKLGFEYSSNIEQYDVIEIPSTGREVRKKVVSIMEDECQCTNTIFWETQPYNDNTWKLFDDLLDAIEYATPPREIKKTVEQECLAEITEFVNNYEPPNIDETFEPPNLEENLCLDAFDSWTCYSIGIVEGEKLLADSIRNILSGHNLLPDKPGGI